VTLFNGLKSQYFSLSTTGSTGRTHTCGIVILPASKVQPRAKMFYFLCESV
jgi:hypothetical protein